MQDRDYLNFDLLFERKGRKYRVRVISSPTGQAAIDFSRPFSKLEFENLLLRMGQPRRHVRRVNTTEMEAGKALGEKLFKAVFQEEVYGCLRSSLNATEQQQVGLRIRLRLADTPELADLPWEYLYDSAVNRFFSLSGETPIVRYLDLPKRITPLLVKPPLKVLVMISSPHDFAPLDVEKEWETLKESLGALEKGGTVVLERLDTATLSALQRSLRGGPYHIFHFIGHGGFDNQRQDGMLIFEDNNKRGQYVYGEYLGTIMHDHRPLRLAILNACEGARQSPTDPFSGTSQSLVQQGIPAVIAMQFEITDDAAISFAQGFYGAVVDGYPIDAALSEARKSIYAHGLQQGLQMEWGTPVLYMRTPDGKIFDIEGVGVTKTETEPVKHRKVQFTRLFLLLSVVLITLSIALWKFLPRGDKGVVESASHSSEQTGQENLPSPITSDPLGDTKPGGNELEALRKNLESVKSEMFQERAKADAVGASINSRENYNDALKLEQEGDDNFDLGNRTGYEAAKVSYTNARKKFQAAREGTEQLLSEVETSKTEMITAEQKVPDEPVEKEEDANYQRALEKKTSAENHHQRNELRLALTSFKEAKDSFDKASNSISAVLKTKAFAWKSRADSAKADLIQVKQRIDKDSDRKSNTRRAEAEQIENEGDSVYKKKYYESAFNHYQRALLRHTQVTVAILEDQSAINKAIQDVITRYDSSIENENMAQLKALHKEFTKEEGDRWSKLFSSSKDLTVITKIDSIRLVNNSAILAVTVILNFTDNKNERRTIDYKYNWTLEKIEGKWLISSFAVVK